MYNIAGGSATDDILINTARQKEQIKIKKLMELEGQCKIEKITILRLNILKAIFLTLLAIITFIGFLFLVWYKWFRVKLWFSECQIEEASHVYVESEKKNDEIAKLTKQNERTSFYFKNLRYILDGNVHVPVGFYYQDNFSQYISEKHITQGMSTLDVEESRKIYGRNEHPVDIPNYFQYLLDVLLKPFFLLQYLVCLAYFIESYLVFTILNLVFSIITTSINYVLTYLSYKKIKQMAEKSIEVKVLRNKQFIQLSSSQLVPGDLIDPQGEIMCDCILVKGQIYVNEASLTGQNIPIGKFPASNIEQSRQSNSWLYQGSKIVEKREGVLALVIYTGYTTRRGRIIRKILTKVSVASQIFKKAFYFLLQAFVVSMIIYLATLGFMRSKNISDLIVGFRFVDFLGWAFPPTFPIYFNVAYSFAIVRLKRHGVLCMEPDKTVQAGNLKIMCFDKTGTLTENAVQVYQVLRFKDANTIVDITNNLSQGENDLVSKLFATCHTTRNIDGKFLGDEIDVRMFLFSKYNMQNSTNPSIRFSVKNNNQNMDVLRINQFQSRFQSMSVLVRDKLNNKVYAFIKGAPEKIEKNSKFKVNQFDKTVTSLSLGGYRTIAYGYKTITQNQVNKYLQGPREIFDQGITALGFVAFQNKLKHDTRETIDRIVLSGIEPKIITGDNIFIAVETGIRAGVISSEDHVILLKGKNQPEYQNGPRIFKGILLIRTKTQTTQNQIQLRQDTDYLTQNLPIAIDNDFLTLDPPPILTHSIKLFARITPQNKALIIMKFKKSIQDEFNQRSQISKLCGELKRKVGMCGDGANDLIAIRQSDVGIGISNSDASYAATFTIKRMLDVDYIIRDSKATTTNIVEMIRYYEFISFLKIPSALLMIIDTAYLNEKHILFTNFTCTVIYPILQAMSRPAKIVTRAIPNGNFLGLINQFRFWGSLVLATAGLIGGYFYFYSTNQFQPNPSPIVINNWYPYTYSATVMFILLVPPFAVYSIFFYIGAPWKERMYRNYPLFILTILNIISAVALHYITRYAYKPLAMLPIGNQVASIILGISLAACILGFVYNEIITYIVHRSAQQNQIDENDQDIDIDIDQDIQLQPHSQK